MTDETSKRAADQTGLPDRLAINPASPHFNEAVLARGIGVKFKGVERTNIEEYCLSEQWVRVAAGKAKDRKGNPITMKLKGELEVWFES